MTGRVMHRIPLTIVAPGGDTEGVIVGVMVKDLDALEVYCRQLSNRLVRTREALSLIAHGHGDAVELANQALGPDPEEAPHISEGPTS